MEKNMLMNFGEECNGQMGMLCAWGIYWHGDMLYYVRIYVVKLSWWWNR